MRRAIAIILLFACAGLVASLLYRPAATPASPPAPMPSPPQLVSPEQEGLSNHREPVQLSRDEDIADTPPDRPTKQVDPVIVVRARSQTGAVRGGEVRLLFRGDSPNRQSRNESCTLDASGTAVFKLADGPPEQVIVRVPGYAVVSRRLESETRSVEFYMQLAGTLRVRLLDGAGRLLPNRYVQAYAKTRMRSDDPRDEIHCRCGGITDERGVAMLDSALPGPQEVTAFEYSHWNEAKGSPIEAYPAQVTDVTLIAAEKEQSTYAGVLFPSKAIPEVRYFDTGEVNGYRLFYVFQGGGGDARHTWLFREWDQGFMAVVPAPPGARLTAFLAECDDKMQMRPGRHRSKPFEILVGATITCVPEWEK